MKLSEALVLRADLQKRVEQLRERLRASALVQEGLTPPEDPRILLSELDALLGQLGEIMPRINRTNLTARLPDGTTLTEALAARDMLNLRRSVLKVVADTASQTVNRYSRSEIRSVPTIAVGDLRRQMDDLARRYRELDLAIQAANWATDLQD